MTLNSTHWTAIGPAPVDSPGVSLGSSAGRIDVAAPDPGNVDTMYVGAKGGGIWKTGVWTNPVPTWIAFTDDMPSTNIGGYHPLVVHPKHHETVFGLVGGPGAGVLRSTNFGIGWQLIGNGLFEGAALCSIAVHPTDVNILYVSVWRGGNFCAPGVYKSTDGGAHWTNLTTFHDGYVSDVIIAKWDHKTLFAGMIPGSNTAGFSTAAVYRSTDEGAHWHSLGGTGLPSSFFVKNFIRLESGTEKGRAYATVFAIDSDGKELVSRFRTTNGGDFWNTLAATPGTPETRSWHVLLGVDPKDGKHIFVNDKYALFESKDSGDTWKRADKDGDKNIGDDWVNIAFDAQNKVVVTADRGVYHFDPANGKWEQHCGNLQVTQLYTITLTPQNTDRCYGIAQDHTGSFKFTGSVLWDKMPGGSGETGKVLVDPKDKKRLYASDPLAPQTALVKTSTDGGQNWTVIHTDNNWDKQDYGLAYSVQKSFAMDPSNAKRLVLGTNKVFECKDATVANPVWKAISDVLSPSTKVGDQYITALAIAPSAGKVLYAATSDGHVWTTADDGGHWHQNDTGLLGSGVGKVVGFAIDPNNTKRFFAVTNGAAGKNIWFHDPADGNWKNISGDMPWNLGVASIAVDFQFTPNVIYVGSARGVYRSIDLGLHWKRFGKDMPQTTVSDLQTLPTQKILAAGTSGRGVFEILLSDPKAPMEPVPDHIQLPARPARLPDVEAYGHIGDLMLLPGKQPGQPLVDAHARNIVRGPK
jgi:photosystem II stability/assembly factor-like uncharacterized protein